MSRRRSARTAFLLLSLSLVLALSSASLVASVAEAHDPKDWPVLSLWRGKPAATAVPHGEKDWPVPEEPHGKWRGKPAATAVPHGKKDWPVLEEPHGRRNWPGPSLWRGKPAATAAPHGKKYWPVPEEARKMTNPVPLTEAALASAKAIFDESCANCHGDNGKGDGPDAAMYSVQPADLTDAHMMSEMTDGEIFYKITEGRKPMPTFKKTLSDEQRWQLVHYVRSFAPQPKPAPAPKKTSPAKKAPGKSPGR